MSDSAVPGWYHAEGDPPNTERYWDGSAWTEGPRPIGGGVSATPEVPSTPVAPGDTPTVIASTPMPGSDMPATEVSEVETPEIDMPATDMPATGNGGLDSGFPSIDDTPSPGGFSTTTPTPGSAPSFSPAGMPPQDMPGTGPSVTPGFGGPSAFPGAPMGAAGQPSMFTEASQATTSLVLSIVGFFCCGLFSVAGVYLGYNEKKGIDEGRRDPANKGQAVAALVIGGVSLLVWLFVVGIIGLAAIAG